MTSLVLALGRLALAAGLILLAIFLWFWLSAQPATAGSQFNGDVEGWEFCTQSVCGAAYFLGLFHGRGNEAPDSDGVWQLSVRHEELPEPQQSAVITGGDWRLRVGWRTQLQGEVDEGTLYNNGDETFLVNVKLARAGEEAIGFFGLLDHSGLPPSVRGCILQAEPSDPPTIAPCG